MTYELTSAHTASTVVGKCSCRRTAADKNWRHKIMAYWKKYAMKTKTRPKP